jgi:hypothetical protein
MTAEGAYQVRQKIDVPVDAAWQILTCAPGARRWLADPEHPGVRVGAAVPVWGSKPAEVEEVDSGKSFALSFPSGRRASLDFRSNEDKCELVVTDHGIDGRDSDALAAGWNALLSAARFVVDAARDRRTRQAVVVVHGIGSQRPQSTLRSFTDALIDRSDRFNKPDLLAESFELRRYQLERTRTRPRTDLFELYWANKVPGTKVGQTVSWLRSIVLRPPGDVDKPLRPIAYLFWFVVLAAAMAVVSLFLALGLHGVTHLWAVASGFATIAWVSAVLSLIGAAVNGFLVSTLGDAARYLDAAPDNIAVRQAIRQSGVELLRRLHGEGSYDRITLVGHSLGSVICYDIIRLYWSEVHQRHGAPSEGFQQSALKTYEKLVTATEGDVDQYRKAQRDLWCEYRRLGHPWLITDLITVGSPLAHAETLMARSPQDLAARIADLELPTCPPQEKAKAFDRRARYLLDDGRIREIRIPTHAAPFGITRWTNLYAPTKAIIFGDPIGGTVAAVFGRGVKDIAVTFSSWWRRYTPLAHTSYWREPATSGGFQATRVLRERLDLDSRPWLDDAVASLPWNMRIGNAED